VPKLLNKIPAVLQFCPCYPEDEVQIVAINALTWLPSGMPRQLPGTFQWSQTSPRFPAHIKQPLLKK